MYSKVILFCCVITVVLYAKIVQADKLTLNTVVEDLCSRRLSKILFQICTGDIPVSDMPQSRLSKIRSKRAALFITSERFKRQVVDECCSHSCTISQLIEYCPDDW